MTSRFSIKGSKLHFQRLDLDTDGAHSAMTGDIDFSRWPEQIYHINSHIDFPTGKNIFFLHEKFTTSGQGDFQGYFHLFKGGRELKGTFTSPDTGVKFSGNDWRFRNLRGSVLWTPDRLEISDTTGGLLGGAAKFYYRLAPLNGKGVPARAVWDAEYRDVDLPRLTDFLGTQGIRLAGRITGRNHLEWPLGKWSERVGGGEVTAEAPGGVKIMTRELPAGEVERLAALPVEAGPFNSHAPLGYVPVAGHITYAMGHEWIELAPSWTATPKTYVSFEGRTAYGTDSRIPFHVTSLDWQESDRVLAGIMTAFGSPTGAVEVGGSGQFDGVMLLSFTKPRIEGTFTGEHMRAWDVDWGHGRAALVIENGYVAVSESVVTKGESTIQADGLFSLGYPRRDNGEEINARITLTRRPLVDLRHAFELDLYPMEGFVSGRYHLYGKYETPYGYGNLVINDGVAYGETFENASASLRFEGSGVRLDAMEMHKSTGLVTGAAWVGWDGNYSFNADGTKIPVESLKTASFPRAPLSGRVQFTASGTGTFDVPKYEVRVLVDDLFAGDEGIGQVTGRLALNGELLTIERLDAASKRLVVSGSGRIAMTDEMDADVTLRFSDTSLDPYIRFFQPDLSPFTTAVAGGTIHIVGELADPEHLVVDTTVEQLDMKLFDYQISNRDPETNAHVSIELTLDQKVVTAGQMRLFGEGTRLEVTGNVGLKDSTVAVRASGDANLSILQGFNRDIRSSGGATLRAEASGSLDHPVFSGSATIESGRIRHLSLPHSLDSINGRLSFDANGIRVDTVRARLAEGDVQFGGRIGVEGFAVGDINLTAAGTRMRLRYPEGFQSVIDADLSLRGRMTSLLLGGTVTVHDALYSRRFEATPDIFSFTGSGASGIGVAAAAPALPLRYDVEIVAPNSLRIDNNLARAVASADLRLTGTYDRPILGGRADIDRGTVTFEGNRYLLTRGTISFANPTRIEPYFDIEAETRVRVPSQTYRVTLAFRGTAKQMTMTLDSDPPLSQVDIVTLLLGQTSDIRNAELRPLDPTALTRAQTDLVKAFTARLLTGTISAPVTGLVERTFGVDFQISPSIGSDTDPLSASARITLGRRISNRAYVTFTRALGTVTRDQIVVLEYDQNDRTGWVLTQNNNGTFAIDFRVRHVF